MRSSYCRIGRDTTSHLPPPKGSAERQGIVRRTSKQRYGYPAVPELLTTNAITVLLQSSSEDWSNTVIVFLAASCFLHDG